MSKIYQDMQQIKKTLEIFQRDNGLFELRTFLYSRAKSGYFTNIDKILNTVRNSTETFYFVLNEIKEDCYKRENKDKLLPTSATTDNDIISRN